MEKLEAISYFSAMQMFNAAQQEAIVASGVAVDIGKSVDFPDYALSTSHCYTICVKGHLLFVIDIDLQRLVYFINRANSLSLYM